MIKKYFKKQKFMVIKWGGWPIEIVEIEDLSVRTISGTTFIAEIRYRYGDLDSGFSFTERATTKIEKTADSYKIISFDRKR